MIVGLDVGTTRVKAALFDASGRSLGFASAAQAPLGGGEKGAGPFGAEAAELSSGQILKRVGEVLDTLARTVAPREWRVLSLTTQRGSLLLERAGSAMSGTLSTYLDRRPEAGGSSRLELLDRAGQATTLRSLCSWLVELFSGAAVETEATAAPEREAAAAAGLDVPALVPSGYETRVGRSAPWPAILREGLPLVIAGGDKNCEHLGMGTTRPGQASISLGTALSLGVLTREMPGARPGLFISPAAIPGTFNIEAGLRFAGAAKAWLSERLRDVEGLPRDLPPHPELCAPLCLPFIGGNLFEADAQAAWIGVRRSHDAASLAQAFWEGIVHELRRGFDSIATKIQEISEPLPERIVLGGGNATPALTQWIADALEREIALVEDPSCGARGAAMVAALAQGCAQSELEAWGPPPSLVRAPGEGVTRWRERGKTYRRTCAALAQLGVSRA